MRAARSRRACVHVPRHVLPRSCRHDLFPLTHTWRCTATQAQATRTLEGSLLLGHAVRGSWRWPLRRSGERDPPWLPRRAESKNHPIRSVHARSIQSIRRQGRVHADRSMQRMHAWVRWPGVSRAVTSWPAVAGARSVAGREEATPAFLPARKPKGGAAGRWPRRAGVCVRRSVCMGCWCVQRRCDVRGEEGKGEHRY